MKFLFSSCSSTPERSDNDFHKNLLNGMLKNATRYDDEDEDDDERNANDWAVDSDLDCQVDDEDNYMIDEDNETEYSRELEKNSKRFKLKQLSLPLSETIAEFVQDLSDEEFFINDLSFILDMSRKRAISPYALIVALLYLKRLKSKPLYEESSSSSSKNLISRYFNRATTNATTNNANRSNGLTNAELCLISIILATKYLVDEGEAEEIYNQEWAECVDLPIKQLNSLERKFLAQLNWELFVSSEEFWRFTKHLSERITRKKVKHQSNHCTYSDLECLLSFSSNFSSLQSELSQLVKVLLVCSSTLVYLALSTYLFTSTVILMKNMMSSLPTNDYSHTALIYSHNHMNLKHPNPVEPLVNTIINEVTQSSVKTEQTLSMTETCESSSRIVNHPSSRSLLHIDTFKITKPNKTVSVVRRNRPVISVYSINLSQKGATQSWIHDSLNHRIDSNVFRNLIEGF